jgi:hypothetical protein
MEANITNQPINSSLTSCPALTPERPVKNKKGFTPIFIGFLMLFVVVAGGVYYLGSRNNKSNSQLKNETSNTTKNTSQNNPVRLETITLTNNLDDSLSELIFSEGKLIYTTKLDGSSPKLLTEMDDYVTILRLLPNKKDLFIETEKPEVLREEYDKPTNKMIPVMDFHTTGWILKSGSQKAEKLPANSTLPVPIDLRSIEEMARYEIVSTKPNSTGGMDILLDKLDGSPPTKVGVLTQKPLERNNCGYEIDTKGSSACIGKYAPSAYFPSFDGSYLLNIPHKGGGLGEPSLVVSKDGSKVHKIDFYWYVANAVWVDNNKLLTKDQNGIKIFTFNNDGTFTKKDLPENIIGDQFNQPSLSPNRKLLASFAPNLSELVLLDIDQLTKKSIDKESSPYQTFGVIGWNNDSTKLLYSSFVESNSKEIKVYDTKTGKASTVAKLAPEPQDWVKVNRTTFGNAIFDIR